jgi:hypothetical protein
LLIRQATAKLQLQSAEPATSKLEAGSQNATQFARRERRILNTQSLIRKTPFSIANNVFCTV